METEACLAFQKKGWPCSGETEIREHSSSFPGDTQAHSSLLAVKQSKFVAGNFGCHRAYAFVEHLTY